MSKSERILTGDGIMPDAEPLGCGGILAAAAFGIMLALFVLAATM